MRIIHFTADQQILSVDSNDIQNLIKGSENYYKAFFSLSQDYKGCLCAAKFTATTQVLQARYVTGSKSQSKVYADSDIVEYVGLKKNACVIPANILAADSFKVRLYAQKDDMIIPTSEVTINQGE